MQPDRILARSSALVMGDRGEQHGAYQENMDTIAALWTAYSGHRFKANDVAWMMLLVKAARAKANPKNLDNAIDAAGYAAIAGAVE